MLPHFYDWTTLKTSNDEHYEQMRRFELEVFLNGEEVKKVTMCITGSNGWVKVLTNIDNENLSLEIRCLGTFIRGNVEIRVK